MLKLAIATGWSIEYIDNMPESLISEFMALNSFSPFTYDAQSQRDGLIASILYNKDVVKKKDIKLASDLLPYLKEGIPDWLKDPLVVKAQNLIKSVEMHKMFSNEQYIKSLNNIKDIIKEEIEIQRAKDKPDYLVINELIKLI